MYKQGNLFDNSFEEVDSPYSWHLDQLKVLEVGLDLLRYRDHGLRKENQIYTMYCPMHFDMEEKFQIYPEDNSYYCYTCETEGGPLSLLFRSMRNPYNYLKTKFDIDVDNKEDFLNLYTRVTMENEDWYSNAFSSDILDELGFLFFKHSNNFA